LDQQTDRRNEIADGLQNALHDNLNKKPPLGRHLMTVRSRSSSASCFQRKTLTKDEARRIAINVSRLPELGKRDGNG
jgi:hypothetical protein